MTDIMVKVDHITKQYRLGAIGGTTLRESLQSGMARLFKKDDPNLKIGEKQHTKNEKFLALNDISFEVKKGEAIGIIGHNGAGKSTLLKLLCRVTSPTSGEIGLNGRIASMLEVGTGFHPELTGRENIYMNGAILGMTKAEIDSKLEDIIEFSEVRQFIDTPVKRYSSGMYVKLAFSVAAHLESEIMIMDEVLAVGDMKFQQKCLKKMREAASNGRTVLYVSHNMNTIRQLCSRCIVMDHGQIIFDGDCEKAINIYMGVENEEELPVYYDLSVNQRKWQFGLEARFLDVSFLDKTKAVYEIGEPIKMVLNIASDISIDDAQVLIQISDKNGVLLGMAISDPFNLKITESQPVSVVADLHSLAHDVYHINFEIIKKDTDGNYYSYDNPSVQIPIQLSNEFAHGIYWDKLFWGSVQFPDMKVL